MVLKRLLKDVNPELLLGLEAQTVCPVYKVFTRPGAAELYRRAEPGDVFDICVNNCRGSPAEYRFCEYNKLV